MVYLTTIMVARPAVVERHHARAGEDQPCPTPVCEDNQIMDRICDLPADPYALLEHDGKRLVLAFADGLAVLSDETLSFIDRGAMNGAARGPDGCIYCTRGEQILCFDVDRGGAPEDVTGSFAGTPAGERQVVCTPDGDIWVEGCTTRRCLNGTFHANPQFGGGPAPIPRTVDVYGNLWSLADTASGRQVLVLPANAPETWQVAWLAAGPWEHLLTDGVGHVWVCGPDGWQRFCPRHLEAGWQGVSEGLPAGAATAVGYSPNELVMAAYATGELVELDTNSAGEMRVRLLAALPDRARSVHTDRTGAIWAATDDGLYRRDPADGAWQQNWEEQRGRLPGGGNHDIFSVVCRDKLYVAGDWAGQWGLPPAAHVLDELFAFDPRTGYWEIVSRMREPRRYNGIAEMNGQIWVIGGETRTPGWKGEGQVLYTTDIYDPASRTWSPGPSLNVARTDPFVVSCNSRIYAIGGAAHNSGPKLDSVESIGSGEDTWRLEPSLPEPTRQGHACVLDGVIYCASIDGIFAFDSSSGRWDDDSPQPGEIGQAPLAAAYRGEIWIMGGFKDQQTRCYNPTTRTWRAGPDLPVGLAWGAAAVMDGRLIVAGGAHRSAGHQAVVFDDRTYVLRDDTGAAR